MMLKQILVLCFAVVANATANIFIKAGMRNVDGAEGLEMIKQSLRQPFLLAGVIMFGIALGAYSYSLTKLNLSVAYPIMVSAGLIIVVLGSLLFFKEIIRPSQYVGFCFILLGVWLVAK